MQVHTIKATVMLDGPFWVAIFERQDKSHYAVARHVFGKEPTDAELYEFVLTHYDQLKFTTPQDFTLVIKRKNPKRVKREVIKEMEKAKKSLKSSSHAQDVLREELEKNKKIKKSVSKAEKEMQEKRKFDLKQEKKKKKQKGH
jgi:predicted RND superfamily exporter protein